MEHNPTPECGHAGGHALAFRRGNRTLLMVGVYPTDWPARESDTGLRPRKGDSHSPAWRQRATRSPVPPWDRRNCLVYKGGRREFSEDGRPGAPDGAT